MESNESNFKCGAAALLLGLVVVGIAITVGTIQGGELKTERFVACVESGAGNAVECREAVR